jgi:hypothetical protein
MPQLECSTCQNKISFTDILPRLKIAYLSTDLALRNLLVTVGSEGSKYLVKVSDFGMSRIGNNYGVYSANDRQTIPVKWCSPEAITYGKTLEL